MKYSTKLSDTVHVMVLIAINQEKSLSSASIAESVHTNPGFVRQLMLKLKKAELMTSVAGHARPSLSKPADQITLLDIYKAVEGDKPLLHLDTHTNPDCGVGINIQLSLQGFYNEIQKTAEEKMNMIDVFEEQFGRPLTPMEFDSIKEWVQSGYSEEMILKALKEAVKSQVLTLRYIEGILINWAQNGVKERYIDEKRQERKRVQELSHQDYTGRQEILLSVHHGLGAKLG